MDRLSAIRRLDDASREDHRYVYRTPDLSRLLDAPRKGSGRLSHTIRSLIDCEALERVTKGVYIYHDHRAAPPHILHDVALALRPRDVTVESFETAAAIRNLTTQMYPLALTCATTGSSGKYSCSYGQVELVHTEMSGPDLWANSDNLGNGELPLAHESLIVHNMRRCGRPMHEFDNLREREEDELDL